MLSDGGLHLGKHPIFFLDPFLFKLNLLYWFLVQKWSAASPSYYRIFGKRKKDWKETGYTASRCCTITPKEYAFPHVDKVTEEKLGSEGLREHQRDQVIINFLFPN